MSAAAALGARLGRLAGGRGRRAIAAVLAATVTIAALIGVLWVLTAQGVPVLAPVYQIETVSNGHRTSLPLEMGQPGVPQVPRPVDVNGDGISDILVAVNVVNLSTVSPLLGGLSGLTDPRQELEELLAPNIEIYRDPVGIAACVRTVTVLSRCSPPLKVQVKLTVHDVNPLLPESLESSKVIRFGYDTGNDGGVPRCATPPCADDQGRQGSIPPYFKATLFGLESFFNPVTAVVSTRGFALLDQATQGLDGEVRNGYEGPLDLVGSIGDADGLLAPGDFSLTTLLDLIRNLVDPDDEIASELRLGYRPWPGDVGVTYQTDDEGQHVTYRHLRRGEVDLDTHLATFDRRADILQSSVVFARVDRLPRNISFDLNTGNRSGEVRYVSRSDGRPPDVRLEVLSEVLQVMEETELEGLSAEARAEVDARLQARLPAVRARLGTRLFASLRAFVALGEEQVAVELVPVEPPLLADVDVEAIADRIEGQWAFPAGGPAAAAFCAGAVDPTGTCEPAGQGVGAVDARIRDFYEEPSGFDPFAPEQQQFLSFQTAPGGLFGRESLITGRVDRIRELRFNQSDAGFDARARVGDGELPLELNFLSDERSGEEGVLVDMGATVLPLPDDITISFAEPGEDQRTDPLELVYESSRSVDVDSRMRVLTATGGTECGQAGTICGELRARHIPARISVRIGTFESSVPDIAPPEEPFAESRVLIDTTPRPGAPLPDFFADITVGQEDGTPTDFSDDVPMVAEAGLLSLPPSSSIRAQEGNDETLGRLEFHACDRLFDASPPACATGTESDIGALSFSVRNWLERPAGLPILQPPANQFATIAVRGRPVGADVDFEANGKVTEISRLVYRNTNKIFGVSTKLGPGTEPLAALVDVGRVDLPDDAEENGRIDVQGRVTVDPLPREFDLCIRHIGQPLQALTDQFTDACETADPFGDGSPLPASPLSVHYRTLVPAAEPFVDVSGDVTLTQRGLNDGAATDDHILRARASVENLPPELTLNMQAPEKGEEGPIRGRYDAPSPTDDQIDIDFALEETYGDLICQDPRVPAEGQEALCVKGRIENLPSHATFFYDPTLALGAEEPENLRVVTSGSEQMDLRQMEFSSIKPNEDDPDEADVIIATGELIDLPQSIAGTLILPEEQAPGVTTEDPVVVDLTADPPVGTVDVTARNYIAPDPLAFEPPDQRDGVPDPDDVFTFRQRGDDFKAQGVITDVRRVGFRTGRTAGPDPVRLDTNVVNVDFGHGSKVIRAFVDIDDGVESIIGDVTLSQVPSGLSVCFRGPKDPATTALAPIDPTFCDTAPGDDETAFEFRGEDLESENELDVDAFFRQATGGGADVLAGTARITNVPPLVQGTFHEDGNADVGGFDLDGTPNGIDKIRLHLATFDIDDHGYADAPPSSPPFEARTVARDPFPAEATPRQHVGLAADDSDFEVVARIGETPASGVPGSDLQRLLVRKGGEACDKPTGFGSRPDYPFYPDPETSESTYTCARIDFQPVGSGADPLDLSAVIERGGEIIALRDGGLTDVPDFIQLNLAESPALELGSTDPERPFRTPCGPETSANDADCMPPLLRFDSASLAGTPILFGTLELGPETLVGRLKSDEAEPRAEIANLDAVPTGSEWVPPPGDPADPQAGDTGVRAKIGTLEPEGGGDSQTAVKVGVRLAVPESLTVDQIQDWSLSRTLEGAFFEAKDLRFHYAVRDDEGTVVSRLGHLAALIHKFNDGGQILLSDGGEVPLRLDARADADGDLVGGTLRQGLDIPGELGLELYLRNNKGEGRNLIQVDGRTSHTMDLRARLLRGSGEGPGLVHAQVLNAPAVPDDPGYPAEDPSFRLQAEIIGGEEALPEEGGGDEDGGEDCTPLLCAETEVDVRAVNALFDFRPEQDAPPARLVKAVARTEDGEGFQVQAFRDIDGGPAAHITANGGVDINPINVYFHAGIPFLGSVDFALESSLNAGASLDRVHDFSLKHKTLHLRAENRDALGNSVIGPVDFNIYLLHADAWALFVKLLGVDFFPPSPPPLAIPFYDCSVGGIFADFLPNALVPGYANFLAMVNNNSLPVPGGAGLHTRDVVAWPFDDARLHFSGVLGPAFILRKLAAPFFCLSSPEDIELITSEHPGDPIPLSETNHPVDGAPSSTAPTPTVDDTPAEPPDLTVGGDVRLCGDHHFAEVTVNGTLRVSNIAVDDSTLPGDAVECASADRGRLTLIADAVTVNGTLTGAGISSSIPINPRDLEDPDDDEPWSNDPANGNSGGGHGGDGGDGSSGSGGSAFGNDELFELATEAGGPGSASLGGTRGRGGGVLIILADTVDVGAGGLITVSGAPGTGSLSGACASGSDPNTGIHGAGGGAGGGLVIAAAELQNAGQILAEGGDGGDGRRGGGGGGGGGIVKVHASIRSGPDPVVDAGDGGSDGGCAESEPGEDGDDGNLRENSGPQSRVHPFDTFWHNGESGLPVRYSAAAATSPGGGDDFDVVLCGLRLPPEAGLDPEGDGLVYDMPDVPTGVERPCGRPGFFTPPLDPLGEVFIEDRQRTPFDPDNPGASFTIPSEALANGFHGLWTVVLKPATDGNSCLDHTDVGGGFGLFFDVADCTVEENPPAPDLVFGVDNDPPDVDVTGLPAFTATPGVTASIDALDQPADNGVALLSNIAEVACREERVTPTESLDLAGCVLGPNAFELRTGGDGEKRIVVTVTDRAGNSTTEEHLVTLDVTPPNGSGSRDSLPDLENGWYSTSPTFTLDLPTPADPPNGDGSAGSGSASDPNWRYRFDEGDERSCPVQPNEHVLFDPLACRVANDLPGRGRHTLHFTAVDAVGNRFFDDDDPGTPGDDHPETPSPMGAVEVKIDGDAPTSALLTVPAAPDGSNGWFTKRPWIALSAVDQPGASGLEPGPGDDPGAGVYFRVLGDAPQPLQLFTQPFQLPPGTHLVCYFAVDVAGNEEAERCTDPIRVDDEAPDVSVVPAPADPDGSNGWYVAEPTVEIVGTDASPGSGIDPGFDDVSDLCSSDAPAANPNTPSGVCISIDGDPYRPHDGAPILVREGVHTLRAFSVDVSGQRSEIRERVIRVDLSNPVSAVRAIPPRPARDPWYRRLPRMVLRATDGERNAGVERIEYSVDGGPATTYAAPFELGPGIHTVRFRAFDRSGRAEPMRRLEVLVDVEPAVVRALSPDSGDPHAPNVFVVVPGASNTVRLNWDVLEDLPSSADADKPTQIRATVLVYNALGQLVRRIVEENSREVRIGTRTPPLITEWDGTDETLLGLVPAGVYHYRLVIEDEAGNLSQSGESSPLIVKLGTTEP